jgi:hypothetical protein
MPGTPDAVTPEKAKFYLVKSGSRDSDPICTVDFNPVSLQYTVTNTREPLLTR